MKHNQIHPRTPRGVTLSGAAGFTLIEMVVSLSILSIVFLAMGSVTLLASKALPTEDDTTTLSLEAGDLLRQIVSELQTATSVSVATDKGIAFTVPDRDNDGADESIVYLFGGVPGGALVRSYNGDLATILPSVSEFSLAYETKAVPQPDSLIESAEVLLSHRNPSGDTKDYQVKKNDWIGQYFTPAALPADAVAWSVTRALVRAKTNGPTSGQTLVQIRVPQPGEVLPSDIVLDQVTMYESDLTWTYAWYSFVFSNVQGLTPGDGLCLVLQWVSGYRAADILYNDSTPAGLLTTDNAGDSWDDDNDESMVYYVYGTYTTALPQPPIVLLKSVALSLNAGESPASRVMTKVVTLNQPVMP